MVRVVLRSALVAAISVGAWLALVAAQGGQILGRLPSGAGCVITYV